MNFSRRNDAILNSGGRVRPAAELAIQKEQPYAVIDERYEVG